MRRYSAAAGRRRFASVLLLLPLLAGSLFWGGCEKRDWKEPAKMHWDRDMCERCKMAISERNYAVDVVDPKTHKHYKFDDIGCAILWFTEEGHDWGDRAIIWVKDGKSGAWIDAKSAWYSTDKITPMGFGFTAYKNRDDAGSGEVIDFAEVRRRVMNRGR
ncbi:nitrous oxide reductase accessory protein NosL [Hydrogenimonas sp.]